MTDNKILKRAFLRNLHVTFFLIVIPFTLMQEWFFTIPHDLLSLPSTDWFLGKLFVRHLVDLDILLLHGLYITLVFSTLLIYIRPILQAPLKNSKEAAIKRMYKISGFFATMLTVSMCALGVTVFINWPEYSSLPVTLLVIDLGYRVLWSIFTNILTVYVFIYSYGGLINLFPLYHFPKGETALYTTLKNIVPKIILSLLIFIALGKLYFFFMMVTQANITNGSEVTQLITIHSTSNLVFIILGFIILNIIGEAPSNEAKKSIYSYLEQIKAGGLVEDRLPLYERNELGSLVSSINLFTSNLSKDIMVDFYKTEQRDDVRQDTKNITYEFVNFINSEFQEISQFDLHQSITLNSLQHINKGLKSQHDVITEIPEIVNVMHEKTNNLITTFENVSQENHNAIQLAQHSQQSTQDAVAKNILLEEKNQQLLQKVQETSGETHDIEDVLQTIKNIAEQTKLLSMSASIEAAHGGSSESGFTSVAEEIRKLAELSQDSVNKIAARLAAINSSIENASRLSIDSVDMLSNNTILNNNVLKVIENASKASKEFMENFDIIQDKVVQQKEIFEKYKDFSENLTDFLTKIRVDLEANCHYAESVDENFKEIRTKIQTGLDHAYHLDSFLEVINPEKIKSQHSYSQIFNKKQIRASYE